MAKQTWKPRNMLYPLPAVMVTVADKEGRDNIITIAWTGTVCTNPPMTYISVRPERYSHHMLKETGEFVINLTTRELAYATDYCGVKSGKDVDKFKEMKLTRGKSEKVSVPYIEESPVCLECVVTAVEKLGTHDMFIAKVVQVSVDEQYLDEKGRLALEDAGLVAYVHGVYLSLGEKLGTFGFSVRKKSGAKKTGTAKPANAKAEAEKPDRRMAAAKRTNAGKPDKRKAARGQAGRAPARKR